MCRVAACRVAVCRVAPPQADGEWKSALDELLASSGRRLEPVRKRLAASKRSVASELLGALRAESDERSQARARAASARRYCPRHPPVHPVLGAPLTRLH